MNKGLAKRLGNELRDFNKNDSIKYVKFDYDYLDQYRDNKPTIEIYINGMVIKFIFPMDYPFKAPSLLINEKPYRNYLKINDLNKLIELNKTFGYKCLCCETISCPHNWSPARRLTEFIDEIQKFRKIKIHLESKRIGPIMLNIINKYKDYILPPEIILYICQFF